MDEVEIGQAVDRGKPSADYTGEGAGWNQLAENLSELARSLQDEKGLEHTLNAIVHAAAETVPGADDASITSVVGRRTVETTAATGELPRAVDLAQYETGQGPCLDSLYEQETLRLSNMQTERRWPDFAARATELGVKSMLAVQLYVEGENLGALNMHSRQPDAFTDESEQVALMLASHAAVALAGAKAEATMQKAINSRDLIGQAKGILMERYKINSHDAFRLLVVASQKTNIKLFAVAEYLTSTGELVPHNLRRRQHPGTDATPPAES